MAGAVSARSARRVHARLLCVAAALGVLSLAGCRRDTPTELGPETAATAPLPPPAPTAPVAAPSRITPAAAAAAQTIAADDIRRVVAEIADYSYGGRAPG